MLAVTKMRIWIDLDNSPHAHFFPPIIKRLEEAGYAVELTATSNRGRSDHAFAAWPT